MPIGDGRRTYSDNTLQSMSKQHLIEIIRILEKNLRKAHDMIDYQARNFEMLLIDERVKTVNELLILIEKELPYDICDGNEAYNIIKEIFRKSILEGYKYNDK